MVMDSLQAVPSRGYYVLAVVVFLLGAGLLAFTIRKGLKGIGDKLQPVAAPGKSDLMLAAPGGYTIFYESVSVSEDSDYSTGENVPEIECALISKSTGAPVKLSPSASNITFQFGKRSGKSVLNFQINRPGVYELNWRYPDGRYRPESVLAVGHGVEENIVRTVVEGIAIMLGTFAASGGIVIITAVKRHNASKRLSAQDGVPSPNG
jgi:hypothetical protein